MAKHLGHEEGIALRLFPHRSNELFALVVSDRVAGGRLNEGSYPGPIETGQLETLAHALTAQISQKLRERVTPADVGVPIGGHHQQPQRLGRTQHMAEKQQGGFRRPVDVVKHEQDGRLHRSVGQPGRHRVEEPVALGLGIGTQRLGKAGDALRQFRDEPGQLAAVPPEAGNGGVGRVWRSASTNG